MNKTLEQAIEKIRFMPADLQEFAAGVLEEIAADAAKPYLFSDNERTLLGEGLDDLDAGRIVSDADMAAFWSRHQK